MNSSTGDKIFVDGMRFTAPSEKAPSFVKGQISVNAEKFIPFLEKNVDDRGWLNADLKESKGGNLYLELNTYRRGEKKTASNVRTQSTHPALGDRGEGIEEYEDEIPI